HDELPNGIMFVEATDLTPGIARNATRSCSVTAAASLFWPMPVSCTRTISLSAIPLGLSMRASRSPVKKLALHTIAQVIAISSTMSAAAVRCRRSVERMGRKCMASSRRSVGLELDGGRDLTAAPRGQKPREQGRDDGEHERQRQHR